MKGMDAAGEPEAHPRWSARSVARDNLAVDRGGCSPRSQSQTGLFVCPRGLCVQSDPFRKGIPRKVACGKLENYALLFIDATPQLVAVQNEKRLHSGMADPLVSIYEGVIHYQRVAEGRGLGDKIRVEVPAAEGGMGLTHS